MLKLGYTTYDNDEHRGVYLPDHDRSTHVHVISSSGVGKSKALATWILDDIHNKRGCGVIDPHGDLVKDVLGHLFDFDNVILADLTGPHYVIGYNPT